MKNTMRPGLAAIAALALLLPTEAALAAAPGRGNDDTQAAANIRALLQNDPVIPTVAPRGADVTIVLFSDYQCPYCKQIHPVIQQLLREDRKVKVVYRDWPIFGAGSVEAARTAIAANYQGRHAAFNDAMMQTPGRITSQGVRAAADRAGIDWNRLQGDLAIHAKDIDAAITRTNLYATVMGLKGTPGILVGPYLIPGAVDIANLRRVVARARTNPTGA